MTDHLSFEQLCDLADGVLTAGVEAASRTHLRSCEDCETRLSAITALAASTAALPRDIEPPDDLWADIRNGVTSRESIGLPRMPVWRLRHLVAAGIVIAVASSALTALVLYERFTAIEPRTAAAAFEQAPRRELPATLVSAERGYAQNVAALQRTLNERRALLAPSTVAIVERSLLVADSAIAEARDALARDPGNTALARLLASNYERKIDLLRRATELAPRT